MPRPGLVTTLMALATGVAHARRRAASAREGKQLARLPPSADFGLPGGSQHYAGGVFRRALDPDVDIAGSARHAVDRERVCPDHQESGVGGEKGAQEIDEVRIH